MISVSQISPCSDIVSVVNWRVEFSEEVRLWYLALTPAGRAVTDRVIARLASEGNLLRMPHSRPLKNGLHELRFSCENTNRRITYVFEPHRRVVTLTTFHKQRQNERAELLRARRAQAALEAAREADHMTKKKGRKR